MLDKQNTAKHLVAALIHVCNGCRTRHEWKIPNATGSRGEYEHFTAYFFRVPAPSIQACEQTTFNQKS
jgi:hypothetical protein